MLPSKQNEAIAIYLFKKRINKIKNTIATRCLRCNKFLGALSVT